MTEEEAKTKWCPHVRYSFRSEPSANRWDQSSTEDEPYVLNPVACRCIGSECMAWRWVKRIVADGESWGTGVIYIYPSPAPTTPAYVDTTEGYCGLSGPL